jgi:transposase
VQSNSSAACWVGIDVSQEWVDVAVLQDERKLEQGRWDRTPDGLAALARKLAGYRPQGIALEATGGLEVAVMGAMAAAGLAVVRLNPKRVRDFARAQGLLAKTDKLDAYALALFGARMRPAMRPIPDAQRQQLAAWVTREQQIVQVRASERTRLHRLDDPRLRRSVERVVALLGKELGRIDKQLSEWIRESGLWEEQEARLRTAPGVGPKTARLLLAFMPELGEANRREIAALAGLAPFACESGQWKGRRRIRGGRGAVRAGLYVASWAAVRVAGPLRDFYTRLTSSGKPKQLALIAVARKLLLALNEMMRQGKPWTVSTVHA